MRAVGKLLMVFLIGAWVCASLVPEPSAQIPFVQVQFDDGATWTFECKEVLTFDTLHVVAQNLNMWLVGFDLQIQYPPALLFLEDLVSAPLWLGLSSDGLAIVWQTPQNAFQPIELFRPHVVWTGSCDCQYGPQVVNVGGWPGNPHPKAVRWPEYTESDVLGLFSLICATPPNPIQSTTWGRIKSLYR